MKTIINYCTGGLGNRLRSLSSCYVISQESGRTLKAYWDNITPNGCLAKLNELFENKIDTIELEDLSNLDNCTIYSEEFDAYREYKTFGRNALTKLVNKFGPSGKNGFNYSCDSENIVVFNNNFLNGIDINKSQDFIKNLIPIKEISNRINEEAKRINIDKSFIGIHARGTDFNIDSQLYVNKIKEFVNRIPGVKFFLSTEDYEIEQLICKEFGNKIFIAKKNFYIKKKDINKDWNDHNNSLRDKEHSQEAIMDMFLLAKTNIQIYHSNSTFCEVAKIISEK